MITITLELNRDCNINCSYCYISGKNKKTYMPLDIAIDSINFAHRKLISDNHANKEICVDFLGGEPMLSIEMINRIVGYTKKLQSTTGIKFRYTITTNGTIMNDEILNILIDNKFDIKLSLDGKKEYNDFARKFSNGNGTYDMIKKNLKYFSRYQEEVKKYVQVSSVLTKNNYRAYYENVRHLVGDLGFRFVDLGINSSDKWDLCDFEIIEDQFKKVLDYYIFMKSINDYFSWSIIEEAEYAFKSEHRLYSCGAGIISFYVKYNGDIFTCPSCFDNKFKLGDIKNGLFSDFHHYLIKVKDLKDIDNDKCHNCELSKKCTVKGCFINNLIENESINIPREFSCRMFRLKSKLYKENRLVLEDLFVE